MHMISEILLLTSIETLLLSFIFFSIIKKRKRTAKNIFKLIDDLEKKYILT